LTTKYFWWKYIIKEANGYIHNISVFVLVLVLAVLWSNGRLEPPPSLPRKLVLDYDLFGVKLIVFDFSSLKLELNESDTTEHSRISQCNSSEVYLYIGETFEKKLYFGLSK